MTPGRQRSKERGTSFFSPRDQLLFAAGHIIRSVHHIGSTAVPGLSAKPVIDIAAAVATFARIPEIVPTLTELGWTARGYFRPDDYLLVRESAEALRTHHLHVVEEGSDQLCNYLRFRDALVADADLRLKYFELKKKLAAKFPDDRNAYAVAKTEFIMAVLNRSRGLVRDR